jgi:pimeloyl-ACP methyl ester carboxylesterase
MKPLRIVLVLGLALVVAALALVTRADRSFPELRDRFGAAPSQFAQVLGMPAHFRDEGSGPNTVLLIHGTFASLHTWDAWAAALSKELRVVRVDLPGHGLTGPDPTSDYGMSRTIAFIDAFADLLDLKRFSLAGNSLGGHVAWRYAVAHPAKVAKLVLVDSAGYPRERLPPIIRLARVPVVNRLLLFMTPEAVIERNLRAVYADDAKITPELVQRYHALVLREGNRCALLDRLSNPEPLQPGLVPDLRAPTLVLWGAQDEWIPLSDGKRFAREIPGAKLVVYPDGGHVPQEELPERTVADALSFLR